MRWIAGILLSVVAGAAEVQAVYLLPMGGGLDQYVAHCLTTEGVYRVVADPKRADAVFTDRLGEAFEQRWKDLHSPPENSPADEKSRKDDRPARQFSSGGGKGTIFLVDAKTRQVIWSAYEKPRNSTPDELNRTASRIVQRLKRHLLGNQ